jgi:8-oxo-dGTP pyrophosphatase MutT (NUDIX family)
LLNFKRKPGEDYWDLPGGRMNKGEGVAAALAREVAEETGITGLQITKHLGMALTTIRLPISEEETGGLILSAYACSAADISNLKPEPGVEFLWCYPRKVPELISQFPEELLPAIQRELDL